MNINEKYFLNVGTKDVNRLKILNKILNPNSKRFISDFLHPGMSVLEIGCGIGIMTCWLAQQIGPSGIVYAVDSSQEQIEVAKKNAEARGIKNIEFVVSDFNNIDYINKFDLCYSRFVMIHLKQPNTLIKKYKQVLKQCGIAIQEEPIFREMSTYPNTSFWHDLIDNYTFSSQKNNVDTNIGNQLYPLFQQNHFSVLNCVLTQAFINKEISLNYFNAVIETMGDIFERNDKNLFNKLLNNKPNQIDFEYSRYMPVVHLAGKCLR